MISLDYSVVYQIVIFLVLWIILSKVLFRPYLNLLEQRERRTTGAQHDSTDLEHEGARLRAQYEEKIAQAQAAGYAAKEAILQEARQQREKVLTQVREDAMRILEEVRRELASQVERERQDPREERGVSLFEFFGVAQALASAAEAENHAPPISQIWFPLGNFLIFAFIIVYYALPPVRNFLRSRRDEVIAMIQEASAKKQKAEAIVQDYKGRLARLDQEVQAIKASLEAEGEREKTKLLSEMQILAAKIKEDTRFLADQEVKAARQKIREEMASLAEATARDLIERHLSASDQGRLVEDFIQGIGKG